MEWKQQVKQFLNPHHRLGRPLRQILETDSEGKAIFSQELANFFSLNSLEQQTGFWEDVTKHLKVVGSKKSWEKTSKSFEEEVKRTGVMAVSFQPGQVAVEGEDELKSMQTALILAGTMKENGSPNLLILDMRKMKQLPKSFKKLLEDENIVKIGAKIQTDAEERNINVNTAVDTTSKVVWDKVLDIFQGDIRYSELQQFAGGENTDLDNFAKAMWGFRYRPRGPKATADLYKWQQPLAMHQLTFLRNELLLSIQFVFKAAMKQEAATLKAAILQLGQEEVQE